MKTLTPVIETTCIGKYPLIKGTCFPGVINVYDSTFTLAKTVVVTDYFCINLEDVDSDAIFITNTETGKQESNYSNIIIKCCDSIDSYTCIPKKCHKC